MIKKISVAKDADVRPVLVFLRTLIIIIRNGEQMWIVFCFSAQSSGGQLIKEAITNLGFHQWQDIY